VGVFCGVPEGPRVAVTVLLPRGRQKLRGFCTQKVVCDYLALQHDSCNDS
jgi:hypothetical protein